MRKLTIEELQRMDVAEFKQSEKLPLVVVLDNVRSLHNVGSVFRTADAFRLERVVLCGITACPPSPEIHKTALGAEDSVAWHYEADTHVVVEQLKREGYIVFAVEQVEGSVKLPELTLDPNERYAVVLGNEVKGVQQSVVDAAHYALEIPQYGTKHSLNVSVTAGIVMWEFLKRLPLK
jgi:tRNA G18 (ribose-2'-O)-methylase SpoU